MCFCGGRFLETIFVDAALLLLLLLLLAAFLAKTEFRQTRLMKHTHTHFLVSRFLFSSSPLLFFFFYCTLSSFFLLWFSRTCLTACLACYRRESKPELGRRSRALLLTLNPPPSLFRVCSSPLILQEVTASEGVKQLLHHRLSGLLD